MTTIMSQCYGCRHFIPGKPGLCPAFPDGVPSEILINNVDHRKPVEGDNGIRYQQANPNLPHPLVARDELRRSETRSGECYFCGSDRALPNYFNAVCDSCDRKAHGASGERPWTRHEHTENPVWIDGVRCWRRFVAGSYVSMADPDECASLEKFYLTHYPAEWAALPRA